MAFTRDRTRIPVGGTIVGIIDNTLQIGYSVGYVVEDSFGIKWTPLTVVDEDGVTHQAGVLVEYEFLLLQGDRQMILDLEGVIAGSKLPDINFDNEGVQQNLVSVPLNIEGDQKFSYNAPRTIKVKGARKAVKLSDVWQ